MQRKKIIAFICTIGVVVLMSFAWIAPGFINDHVIVVSGSSMYPTYKDGDVLFVRPVRDVSDIIDGYPVCWVRLDTGRDVIKRLVGYPGDTVELRYGDTYVNGKLVMKRTTESYDNMVFELGEEDYLFLGDNRAESMDGRYWKTYCKIYNIRGLLPDSCLE